MIRHPVRQNTTMKNILIHASKILALIIMQVNLSEAQKKIDHYSKDIIFFGKGGGIAGTETTYALLENGDLYKKAGITSKYVLVKSLTKEETKQTFKNLEFLGINTMQLNDPGNTYNFIQFKDKSHPRIVWSGNTNTPGNLKTFFTILNYYANLDQD